MRFGHDVPLPRTRIKDYRVVILGGPSPIELVERLHGYGQEDAHLTVVPVGDVWRLGVSFAVKTLLSHLASGEAFEILRDLDENDKAVELGLDMPLRERTIIGVVNADLQIPGLAPTPIPVAMTPDS